MERYGDSLNVNEDEFSIKIPEEKTETGKYFSLPLLLEAKQIKKKEKEKEKRLKNQLKVTHAKVETQGQRDSILDNIRRSNSIDSIQDKMTHPSRVRGLDLELIC